MPSPSARDGQSSAPEVLRAAYFDGERADRQEVMLRLPPEGIGFSTAEGESVFWPRGDVHRVAGPDDRLILACGEARARLQLHDREARQALLRHLGALRGARESARDNRRVVFWLIAATISILVCAFLLIPLVAGRVAPLVPAGAEIRLGNAVDRALRDHLDLVTCEAGPGTEALASLTRQLSELHELHVDPQVTIVARNEVNALALPGGRIYVFDGLLRVVDGPDALAGVIAHEIGHVAHRDGLRNLIQAGGTGFLLGLLFGDFVGGGVMGTLVQTSLMASYSRRQELAADRFAAQSLHALGRPIHPFAGFLLDLDDEGGGFLATHPMGEERESAIRQRDPQANHAGESRAEASRALLTQAEWADLREICGTGARDPGA
ncbi:MAG: M48 family metallopeptidase [Salinarimonas sp.]|nr:M48 family metallopeptidase [Salinarimonas sp.]